MTSNLLPLLHPLYQYLKVLTVFQSLSTFMSFFLVFPWLLMPVYPQYRILGSDIWICCTLESTVPRD